MISAVLRDVQRKYLTFQQNGDYSCTVRARLKYRHSTEGATKANKVKTSHLNN